MNNTIIEYAPFLLKSNKEEDELIRAADQLHSAFIGQQKGLISRKLIRNEENIYADLIYWKSEADSHAASAKVASCPACAAYFELMDATDSKQAFSRFTVLRSY